MGIIALDYYGQLLENISGRVNISLTTLRDDIRGSGNRTLTDLFNKLDTLDNALASVATDKLRTTIVDSLPSGSNLIGKIAGDQGVALKQQSDGRLDVYCSFVANPSNLDAKLSTRLSESTFTNRFPTGASLGDSMSNPTTTLIGACLMGFDGSYWERLKTDGSNRLLVNAAVVANPSRLDVALSTRASESTLSSFSGKFPSAASLSDSMGNPSTTRIGSCLMGFDGSYWRRIRVDSSGRLRAAVETLPSLPSGSNIIGGVFADYSFAHTINGTVGTSEVTGTAIDVRRRGGKLIYMHNSQDIDVTVTIEGSYDGSEWFPIRSNITLAAGEKKVGILTDRFGYIRAKAKASSSPSSGNVVITVASMSW